MNVACRRMLFATLLGLSISGVALAASPATGLGQRWPNASDLSLNPNFHVYAFSMAGILYIQINAANGEVLSAIGNADGQYLVLPIGTFAQLVSTPQEAPATTTEAKAIGMAIPVYNDGTTAIFALLMSNGTTQFKVTRASPCTDPAICGGQIAR